MEFRILGPLEAWEGGSPVALGGAKQRARLSEFQCIDASSHRFWLNGAVSQPSDHRIGLQKGRTFASRDAPVMQGGQNWSL
jgi:hypothetical protein